MVFGVLGEQMDLCDDASTSLNGSDNDDGIVPISLAKKNKGKQKFEGSGIDPRMFVRHTDLKTFDLTQPDIVLQDFGPLLSPMPRRDSEVLRGKESTGVTAAIEPARVIIKNRYRWDMWLEIPVRRIYEFFHGSMLQPTERASTTSPATDLAGLFIASGGETVPIADLDPERYLGTFAILFPSEFATGEMIATFRGAESRIPLQKSQYNFIVSIMRPGVSLTISDEAYSHIPILIYHLKTPDGQTPEPFDPFLISNDLLDKEFDLLPPRVNLTPQWNVPLPAIPPSPTPSPLPRRRSAAEILEACHKLETPTQEELKALGHSLVDIIGHFFPRDLRRLCENYVADHAMPMRSRGARTMSEDFEMALDRICRLARSFPASCDLFLIVTLDCMFARFPQFSVYTLADAIQSNFRSASWPASDIEKMLRLILMACPFDIHLPTLLKGVSRYLEEGSPEKASWEAASLRAYDHVLDGVKIRLGDHWMREGDRFLGFSPFSPLRDPIIDSPGMSPAPPRRYTSRRDAPYRSHVMIKMQSISQALFHLVESLIQHPDSVRLLDRLLEVTRPPPISRLRMRFMGFQTMQLHDKMIPVLIPIAIALSDSVPKEYKESQAAQSWMSHFKDMISFALPCEKPPAVLPVGSLSLPPLPNTIGCPRLPCSFCNELNDFLVSNERQSFCIKTKKHSRIARQHAQRVWQTCVEDRQDISAPNYPGSVFTGTMRFACTKSIVMDLQSKKEKYEFDLGERRRIFGLIGIKITDEGDIIEEDA